MPESLIDGTGSGFPVGVTSDNRLKTNTEVSETDPNSSAKNNPLWQFDYMISGTATGITSGSAIGSIIQFIDAGSFVQILTYFDNNVTKVGSWV